MRDGPVLPTLAAIPIPASSPGGIMALSDDLMRLSQRAKEAEDRVAAA
jgi:hypothetical protein